jgi:NADH dehydrogenase (ubiquinone) 1 alpha subcomplex subunit 9
MNGVKTYVGNRGDEFEMRHLHPMFDLGRLRKVFYSSRDRDSMAEVIADADVVVNLIGKYYETSNLTNIDTFPYVKKQVNFSFQEANVDIPRTVAELCTEMQVDNLIHVSCAAAKEDSRSEWARSKWQGEQAVKEVYPWATVIRPTQLFGHEDKLLNYFANAAARLPFVPLVDDGQALTQPVYVADVADVITKVIDIPEKFEGKTIDCFGPKDFTYKELAQFVYDITGQDPTMLDVPKSSLKMMSKPIQFFGGNPMLTDDLVELWSEDYNAPLTEEQYAAESKKTDGIVTMADFGIKALPVEKLAFEYLHRFRQGGYFLLAEGYHGKQAGTKYVE